MDLQIREFSQAIINFINASTLPMEVKRLCLAEIMEQVNRESDACINAQVSERKNAEKERSPRNRKKQTGKEKEDE